MRTMHLGQEIIERAHLIPALEQLVRQMRPNKSSPAGDQHLFPHIFPNKTRAARYAAVRKEPLCWLRVCLRNSSENPRTESRNRNVVCRNLAFKNVARDRIDRGP